MGQPFRSCCGDVFHDTASVGAGQRVHIAGAGSGTGCLE